MTLLNIHCGNCSKEQSINSLVFQARRRSGAGLPFPCPSCQADLYKVGERVKRGASDSQRRSRAQEKRVAQREGGRRQPGSGARDGFEGDVRLVGKYRGECKLTRASSYRLQLSDLVKLEHQAAAGELPVFDIEFQGVRPVKRYVVMPEWVYDTLMSESGRRDDATEGEDQA